MKTPALGKLGKLPQSGSFFSEPSTAASESERKRVLILLIYTAGRALGEQLPTT